MRRFRSLASMLVVLCTAVPSAAVQYRLDPVPGLPAGSQSSGFRINSSGWILGVYRMPDEEYPTSFILQGERRTDLDTGIPGLPYPHRCQAHAVGDGGDVVGHCWYTMDGVYVEQGFHWRNGSTTGLGFLPGDYRSAASDVNAGGQIVGVGMERHAHPDLPEVWLNDQHAVLWSGGVPTSLGQGFAAAVNGETPPRIVGMSEDDMPASWSAGAASKLPCPEPYTIGMAVDVNDAGEAVGHCYGVSSRGQAAMHWGPDGSATVLRDVERIHCRADRIDNGGTVIGHCDDGYFLWDRDHGLQPIQALLDGSATGWSELRLEDSNVGGTIIGHGTYGGMHAAFILTPADPDHDVTSPTGSIQIEDGAAATRFRSVVLGFEAADAGGTGLDAIRFLDERGVAGPWQPYVATRAWKLTAGAGTKTVRVQFRDRAGNVSDADPFQAGAQPYRDTIIYDPIPPTGSIRINRGVAATAVRAVTLKLSASDTGGAGLHSMRFSNGDGTWADWEPFAASKAWELTGGAGTKVVSVKFRDAAGNVSDADPLKAGAQGYRDTIKFTGD